MRTWTHGDDLRRMRLATGMSQEDAARAIGVGLGTYGSWERGTHVPRRDALDLIVEVFNVPPSAIGLDAPAGWELVPAEWVRQAIDGIEERAARRHAETLQAIDALGVAIRVGRQR